MDRRALILRAAIATALAPVHVMRHQAMLASDRGLHAIGAWTVTAAGTAHSRLAAQ
jgi:hypothetical protein